MGVIFSLMLIGCGGGSGGGGSSVSTSTISTSRATVTEGNSTEISQGVYEAARLAGNYASAPLLLKSESKQVDINGLIFDAKEAVVSSLALNGSSVLGRQESESDCSVGGSISIVFPDLDENATVFPENGEALYSFNNCNEGDFLFDGDIDFTWSGYNDSFGFESYTVFFDLTITDLSSGLVDTLSGTAFCSNFGDDCSFREDFSGADGTDYRVEDVVVTGDSSGYNMTARVYHETYGYVDIVATGITYCPSGNIATGNILATDSTGIEVLDVSITSCNDCIVTFDGVSEVIAQP